MWFDDFETGDHSRWTGSYYDESWGDDCQSTALETSAAQSGLYAQRSEIVCPVTPPDTEHRGYGGLQFSGDTVLPNFTNTGAGLEAPHGIVTTFWTKLDAGYSFGGGRWVSLFTVNPTCNYTERPMTLGLDQPDHILRSAHWWPDGASTLEPSAPSMPMGRWVRITVYLNHATGVMHTWQDGASVEHVTGIVRASHLYCQWHWGLYASGDNDDIVLREDDKVVWRLGEPWTDFSREPWLGMEEPVCTPASTR